MSKTHSTEFILLLLTLPFLLMGCYDRFELDNLAYVIAIGADKGDGEDLVITYQIAIPVKITGENAETGKDTYTTYTVKAPSLSVANTLINTKVSKGINLSHVKLVVYSEEIAKEDLSGHVNILISNTEIRPKVRVIVCEGKAQDFLENVSPQLEASPSRYYELIFSAYNFTTQSETSQLIDLYSAFQSLDRDAYVTYAKIVGEEENKEAQLSGIAIFKGTKMVDKMEEEDFLLAHALLTNNLKQSGFAIPDFKRNNRVISVRLIQIQQPQVQIKLQENAPPHIQCTIPLEAHLVSSGSDINFYEKENEKRLKETVEKKLEEIVTQFFDKTTKEYKADIAGVGKNVKQNFWTWEAFEKFDWLSQYPQCSYDVNVEVKLNISQIISHIIPNVEE